MKKSVTRITAAVLTAALSLNCLTGCSKITERIQNGGGNGGGSGKLEVSLDHSYSSEKIEFNEMANVYDCYEFGGKMLLNGSDSQYNNCSYLYDPADGSSKKVEYVYPTTLEEGSDAYPISYFDDANGNLNVIFGGYSWSVNDDGEEDYHDLGTTIEVYDKDFNVVETRSMDGTLSEDYSINAIVPNPAGGYLVSLWNNQNSSYELGTFDDELNMTGNINLNCQYISNIISTPNGTIFINYENNEGAPQYATLDPKTGQTTDVEIKGMPQWSNNVIKSHDEQYDFYVSDSEYVYGVSLGKKTCEPVINWLNSDFLGNYVNSVYQSGDGKFIVSAQSMGKDGATSLWRLSPRDPEDFKNVTMITMAGLYLPDEIAQAVLDYNRTHTDSRIATVNYEKYSEEGDYEAAINKFKNDMTSGVVADLIVTSGLPYESLANKGIFEDLTPYMGNINEADYFTNFFDSMKYGDKLYQIGFSFDVDTLQGKTELVGSKQGLTMEEFMKLVEGLPDGTEPFTYGTRANVMSMLVISDLKAFSDVKTGTCSFNTPEFVKLLEFCNTFPEEEEDHSNDSEAEQEKYWAEREYQFINNKVAFDQPWFSDIKNAYRTQVENFDDAEVTRVGFPVADENGGNGGRFSAYTNVAMSANSDHKDQCWEFMEMMLGDDYQESLSWSLPVKRSAFDKLVETAMKPDTYIDENGEETVNPNTIWRGDEEIEIPEMPKTYGDDLKAYIEGIRTCSYYDMTIYNIIVEESDKYFAGDQTSQQAADMIQSRVSLYLSEQS